MFPLRTQAKVTGEIFLMFILAFLLVMAAHVASLSDQLGSGGGLEFLMSRTKEWSSGNLVANPGIQLLKILVLNFFDLGGLGVPIGVVLGVASVAVYRRWANLSMASRVVILLSMVAPFTWFVFQPQHIFFHPRYATFLFASTITVFLFPAIFATNSDKNDFKLI
jgi:hypothetical protein